MIIRNRFGRILVIDNDVLVNILIGLSLSNKSAVDRVIRYLLINYSRIWISGFVKREFLLHRDDPKRQYILDQLYEKYTGISDCPISVGKKEILLEVGMKEEDMGEADSLLQMQKAQSSVDHPFEQIVFLSNDRGALVRAEKKQLTKLDYRELQKTLFELGITLPS